MAAKKIITKKVVKKATAKKVAKKATAKKVVKKATAKKVIKKATAKKVVKKATAKKVVKKATAKKVVKKATAKKIVKKTTTKKKTIKNKASLTDRFVPSAYRGSKKLGSKYEFSQDIPETYNTTMIRAIPKDPKWIYLYWEITPDTLNSIKRKMGNDIFSNANFVLRMLDVTDHSPDIAPAIDFEINGYATNWYLKAPVSGHAYIIDYGIKTKNSIFIAITRSNMVHIPRDTVSDIIDEEWSTPSSDKLINFSVLGTENNSISNGIKPLGSSENRVSGEKTLSDSQKAELLKFGSSDLYPDSSPSSPTK